MKKGEEKEREHEMNRLVKNIPMSPKLISLGPIK